MKLSMQAAAFLMLALMLALPAQAGQSQKACDQVAQVLLKATVTVDPNSGQPFYQCYCSVPANPYNQFMHWCETQATQQNMNDLVNASRSSYCGNVVNAARCVR